MDLHLPPVPKPVAAYTPALVIGNTVRTSGQLPFHEGELVSRGHLGDTVPIELGQKAAQVAALNAVAAAAEAAGGLEKLKSVIKVTGFVASTPDFTDHPAVINGASEFLEEVFGGKHIRSAVGVAALPLGASVEIEVEFAL